MQILFDFIVNTFKEQSLKNGCANDNFYIKADLESFKNNITFLNHSKLHENKTSFVYNDLVNVYPEFIKHCVDQFIMLSEVDQVKIISDNFYKKEEFFCFNLLSKISKMTLDNLLHSYYDNSMYTIGTDSALKFKMIGDHFEKDLDPKLVMDKIYSIIKNKYFKTHIRTLLIDSFFFDFYIKEIEDIFCLPTLKKKLSLKTDVYS